MSSVCGRVLFVFLQNKCLVVLLVSVILPAVTMAQTYVYGYPNCDPFVNEGGPLDVYKSIDVICAGVPADTKLYARLWSPEGDYLNLHMTAYDTSSCLCDEVCFSSGDRHVADPNPKSGACMAIFGGKYRITVENKNRAFTTKNLEIRFQKAVSGNCR